MKFLKILLISLIASTLGLGITALALGITSTRPSVIDDVPQDDVPTDGYEPVARPVTRPEEILMPNKGDFVQAFKFCDELKSLSTSDFKLCLLRKMASDAKRVYPADE